MRLPRWGFVSRDGAMAGAQARRAGSGDAPACGQGANQALEADQPFALLGGGLLDRAQGSNFYPVSFLLNGGGPFQGGVVQSVKQRNRNPRVVGSGPFSANNSKHSERLNQGRRSRR